MKNIKLIGALLGAGALLYSCGGGGSDTTSSSSTTPSTASVSFYLTDAYKGSQIQKAKVSIQSVFLVNSSTGERCKVFDPQSAYIVDLTDLASTMRLLDTANCPVGNYDKFEIIISKDTSIMVNNTLHTCQISSAIDSNIQCNDTSGICTMTVDLGSVALQQGQNVDLSVDFEINDSDGDGKQTQVNIDSNGNCSVEFEVEELKDEDVDKHLEEKGKKFEIEGTISKDANGNLVITTPSGEKFIIKSDSINPDDIPQGAKLEVECSSISNGQCIINQGDNVEIKTKLKGKVVNIDNTTNIMEIDIDGDGTADVSIDIGSAQEKEGNIQVGSFVEVKVKDKNGNTYVAKEVEADDDNFEKKEEEKHTKYKEEEEKNKSDDKDNENHNA